MIIWGLESTMMPLVAGVQLWPTVPMEKGSKLLQNIIMLSNLLLDQIV